MVELRPRVDWRQTVLTLRRMLGLSQAHTRGEAHSTALQSTESTLLLKSGFLYKNGSQFIRPAKKKKQRIIRVSFVMNNLIRTYLQFHRCGRTLTEILLILSEQTPLSCWKELVFLHVLLFFLEIKKCLSHDNARTR